MATSDKSAAAANLQRVGHPRVRISYHLQCVPAATSVELPFVLGVLADLSGQPSEPLPPLADRRFREIDLDNFDKFLKTQRPRVAFEVPNALTGDGVFAVDITFEAIENFGPAAVARRIPMLAELLDARGRLARRLDSAPASQAAETPASAGQGVDEFEALLNQNVGGPTGEAFRGHADKLPAIASSTLPETAETIAEFDRRLTSQINLILQHEKFRRLEGAWRGLYFLVSNTETGEALKIRVFNVSQKELRQNARKFDGACWDENPLFRKIYEEESCTFGGSPYGCLVGDFYFDHSPEDIVLLRSIARIAAEAHAPFIAGAAPSLLGMDSWQELRNGLDLSRRFDSAEYIPWRSLRESPESRFIALTCPRVLARLPYGATTVPVEEFDFQEETNAGDPSGFVWSNAAYAMAANITRAFKLYGWCAAIRGMETGGRATGLPAQSFPSEWERLRAPRSTDVPLGEGLDFELSNSGLLPLCNVVNSSDAVFLGAQSLQKPKFYQGKGAEQARVNSVLSARLPYLFALCRFVHYLRCLVRDKVGTPMRTAEMETFLQEWLYRFILPNSENANIELEAQKPLAGAEIRLTEVENGWIGKLRLSPHFQLEAPGVTLVTQFGLCWRHV